MIRIQEIKTKKEIKQFIDLPWKLYKNDPNWVPPLKYPLFKTLIGKDNPLFMNGTHTFFIAFENNEPVGRILVGINEKLNLQKNKKEGYISLYECIQSEEVSNLLLDTALTWLREHNMETVVGPVSPTNGDDSRGLLVKGFDGSPVLMNSYNPEYYPDFFQNYGFEKNLDLYAYYFDTSNLPIERYNRVVEYAMKKYKFRIDKINMKQIEREAKDIKTILDLSMPESWEHLVPPSLEEITAEINNLKSFVDKDLVYIARAGDDPIGIVIALPDYNQVLKRLNGSLLPFGIFKFIWFKRKINGLRAFAQFVVPKYRNKAVNGAIFLRLMLEAKKKNYHYGEGSTIAEMNLESQRSVEKAGGKLYRVYRIYRKDLNN